MRLSGRSDGVRLNAVVKETTLLGARRSKMAARRQSGRRPTVLRF